MFGFCLYYNSKWVSHIDTLLDADTVLSKTYFDTVLSETVTKGYIDRYRFPLAVKLRASVHDLNSWLSETW
jgi:hypothetical protein